MKLESNKKIYFVSDAHLGLPPREKSLQREKLLVQWLDEVKEDAQAEAWVKITGLSSGSSIKCYLWRLSAAAQVSGNPILNGLGEFTINYNNTGNKKKGDSYRAVFGKTTQSVGTAVNVSFEFWP